MKITIVCDVLGEANNGTSLAAYNLINTLINKGHDVKVVCPDPDKKNMTGFYILKRLNLGFLNNYLKKNGVCLAKGDKRIIKAACEDADIVHGLVPFAASKRALKYCKKHHIPFTSGFHMQAENFTSHVFMMASNLMNKCTYAYLWRTYFSKVDAIHYPTEFIRDYVSEYNKKNVPAYVISNGVNFKYFYPKQVERPDNLKNKFVIIMSGRLSKEKNQQELLYAVKRSKYESQIQVMLTGDGPRREYLEKLSKSLKLTNPVTQKLYKHEELNTALWLGDLYVHTSIVEIEAISCLEAIATGMIPVIADSKKSATRKFALDDRCKYESKNIDDLTKHIDYWIEHPEEKKELQTKDQEFIKQFDFETCMDNMEKMLVEVKRNYDKK
ncbi:MAG: glycosyltransferase [Bacilli bacterium]|nr:glycosyltransferase [Bacilli bacterium]